MKYFITIIFVSCSVLTSMQTQLAADNMITDSFGQNISKSLDLKVTNARKKRLPYHIELYAPSASVQELEAVIKVEPNYYRAYFNLGLAYAEAGQYKKGVKAFDHAISIKQADPAISDLTILNSAGWVSMQAGKFKKAEEQFLEFIETDGEKNKYTRSAVRNNLGKLYFALGDYENATKQLSVAAKQFGSMSAQKTLKQITILQSVTNPNGNVVLP